MSQENVEVAERIYEVLAQGVDERVEQSAATASSFSYGHVGPRQEAASR
jgi:hypothetical protein